MAWGHVRRVRARRECLKPWDGNPKEQINQSSNEAYGFGYGSFLTEKAALSDHGDML